MMEPREIKVPIKINGVPIGEAELVKNQFGLVEMRGVVYDKTNLPLAFDMNDFSFSTDDSVEIHDTQISNIIKGEN